MWLPKWLGETYALLHERFGLEIFTFKEAKEALNADDTWLRVALSRLHGSRCVLIIEKTRPKQYGLLQAENFIFLASKGLKEIKRIGQERYLNLICSAARALKQSLRMDSLALYGSVARGRAKDESDVDLLVVSDEFKGTLGSRIDSLASVEEAVSRELAWLEKRGVYAGLSFCPLRKEEVLKFPHCCWI